MRLISMKRSQQVQKMLNWWVAKLLKWGLMIQMSSEFAGKFCVTFAKCVDWDFNEQLFSSGHLNDLENILPYLFAGLFYVLTKPSVGLASTLFMVAALARIAHTIVYTVIVIPQPARGTVWFIHYVIALYMAISVVLHALWSKSLPIKMQRKLPKNTWWMD